MTFTGITRIVDDLGRVVIPREIRHTFDINPGDSVEVHVGDDNLIYLKKHSDLNSISTFVDSLCKALHQFTGCMVAITDYYSILSVYGTPEEAKLDGCKITAKLRELQSSKQDYNAYKSTFSVNPFEEHSDYFADAIIHITHEDKVIGSTIFFYDVTGDSEEPDYDLIIQLVKFISVFINLNMKN